MSEDDTPKVRPEAQTRIDAFSRAKERERNDLASVLTTDQGQALMWRILERCGVYHGTFSASHASASFNEGRRDIALWLLKEMESIDPSLYAHLILSQVKRQAQMNDIELGIARAK